MNKVTKIFIISLAVVSLGAPVAHSQGGDQLERKTAELVQLEHGPYVLPMLPTKTSTLVDLKPAPIVDVALPPKQAEQVLEIAVETPGFTAQPSLLDKSAQEAPVQEPVEGVDKTSEVVVVTPAPAPAPNPVSVSEEVEVSPEVVNPNQDRPHKTSTVVRVEDEPQILNAPVIQNKQAEVVKVTGTAPEDPRTPVKVAEVITPEPAPDRGEPTKVAEVVVIDVTDSDAEKDAHAHVVNDPFFDEGLIDTNEE